MAGTTLTFTIDGTALTPVREELESIASGLDLLDAEAVAEAAQYGPIPEIAVDDDLFDHEFVGRTIILRPSAGLLGQMEIIRQHPTVRRILAN